jgi:hypothetical protein
MTIDDWIALLVGMCLITFAFVCVVHDLAGGAFLGALFGGALLHDAMRGRR